jgi:uncharacterized protein YecA (UPF0149 family)
VKAHESWLQAALTLTGQPPGIGAKTGRNERCPCGSGLKYKHCHGLPSGSGRRHT